MLSSDLVSVEYRLPAAVVREELERLHGPFAASTCRAAGGEFVVCWAEGQARCVVSDGF